MKLQGQLKMNRGSLDAALTRDLRALNKTVVDAGIPLGIDGLGAVKEWRPLVARCDPFFLIPWRSPDVGPWRHTHPGGVVTRSRGR